jgi:5'-3' exonuclease
MEPDYEYFDIAIIDADSILYQVAYTQKSPALCRKELDTKISNIMHQTSANAGVVFVKGPDNFRFKVDVAYKANRKDTIAPDVKERIDDLYEYCKDFAMLSVHGEADDYAVIAAEMARNEGKSFIVSHIDKDLNSISGWHHNFRTGSLYQVTPTQGYMWLMEQILTGDATDNIKGIDKVGPITAKKILSSCTEDMALAAVLSEWQSRVGNLWQESFTKCANNIYLRTNMDDLRPLTFEELKERLSWTTTDTGLLLRTDPVTPLDSSTLSSAPQDDSTLEESNL